MYYISSDGDLVESWNTVPLQSTTLARSSNGIISANIKTGVHSNSAISVVYMADAQAWRLYYQDSDGHLQELAGKDGWFPGSLGEKVISMRPGSPIAAMLRTGPTIEVFCVNEEGRNIVDVPFINGGWGSGTYIIPV